MHYFLILLLKLLIVTSSKSTEQRSKRQLYFTPISLTHYVIQPLNQPRFPFNWQLPWIPGLIQAPTLVPRPYWNSTNEQNIPAISSTSGTSSLNKLSHAQGKSIYGCGTSAVYHQATTRIVDGESSQYGEFPWLVAIMDKAGDRHLCGGSLISNIHILSAAHCFASYSQSDVSQLRVLIGDYNIYDSTDVRHQVRSVKKLIRHSRWNNPPNFNDVALLKLDRPVEFNNYVQAICLPSSRGTAEASFYDSSNLAIVSGWGKVNLGNPSLQATPLKIAIPLVDKHTCQISNQPYTIADSMLCAGTSYQSTCLGDSGGPLAVFKSGRWYQIGVVSWGKNCNSIGVFTRVSSFRTWIDKLMKK